MPLERDEFITSVGLSNIEHIKEKIHIHNLTARRIGIASSVNNKEMFVLPPFGERTLESENEGTLKKPWEQWDYKPWEQLNLIKVIFEKEVTKSSDALMFALGMDFFLLIIFIIRLLGSILGFSPPDLLYSFILPAIIIFLLGFIFSKWNNVRNKLKNGLKTIWEWSDIFISLLPILAIGIGLPAVVIYFFGNVSFNQPSLNLLGRLLQGVFIAVAALLPAFMYFLFTRQKLGMLQERFFREIVQLDPRVITMDDAKSLYENKVNAVYGSEESSSRLLYDIRSPIFIATLVITLGWILTLKPFGSLPINPDKSFFTDFFRPADTAIVFGFLGAYFFSLNMMFRRYARTDLRPKAYTNIIVRIFVVIILVWVLSMVPGINNEVFLFPLAFIVGIFPETGMAIIQEYLRSFKKYRKFFRLEEEKSLEKLQGINLYHRAQLLEEGIENTENLAHHDLVDLMLQTRIPTPRLVDWVDQAILHLHLGGTAETIDSLNTLSKYGIRTATDLEQAYQAAKERSDSEAEELLKRLEVSGTGDKVKQIQVILDTLRDDEWMNYIHHWRDAKQFVNKIFTIDEMIKYLSPVTTTSESST